MQPPYECKAEDGLYLSVKDILHRGAICREEIVSRLASIMHNFDNTVVLQNAVQLLSLLPLLQLLHAQNDAIFSRVDLHQKMCWSQAQDASLGMMTALLWYLHGIESIAGVRQHTKKVAVVAFAAEKPHSGCHTDCLTTHMGTNVPETNSGCMPLLCAETPQISAQQLLSEEVQYQRLYAPA